MGRENLRGKGVDKTCHVLGNERATVAGVEWAMGEYNIMRVAMEGSRSLKKVKGSVGESASWSPGERAWILFKVQMEAKEGF